MQHLNNFGPSYDEKVGSVFPLLFTHYNKALYRDT